jgi:VanZ family protein
VLIFVLSGIPSLNSGLGVWDFVLRKIAHMVEFGVLAALVVRALTKTAVNWTAPRVLAFSAGAAFLYAVSDEVHQYFVPGRTASFGDVLIDGCGIMLAILITRKRLKI